MKNLNRYVEQTLKLYNSVDSIMIVDSDTVIRYYYTAYPMVSELHDSEVLGRKLLDVYTDITEETSFIIRCLKTGKSFMNYEQTYTSYLGKTMRTISSAVPIHDRCRLVAVADISVYPNNPMEKNNLSINIDPSLVSRQQDYELVDIITQSPQMNDIKDKIMMGRDSDAPVLVYGKTGTGKEMVVNAIHKCSPRRGGPLITQNCAAIPSTLMESILFGTTKGSFTGANDRKGLFEMADGGTLFLDEINSMELGAQAKILRAIEENKIRRIGDKQERNVDVRIITAMNESPESCLTQRCIREDLYYRVSVIRYDLPELANRKEDIPLLMEHFRCMFNCRLEKNIRGYSNQVKRLFQDYSWPGNIRELKNVIEAAYHSNYGTIIDIDNIPMHFLSHLNSDKMVIRDTNGKSLNELVQEFESKLIASKLRENEGKLSQTARVLQISKQSLWYKMKKYNNIGDASSTDDFNET